MVEAGRGAEGSRAGVAFGGGLREVFRRRAGRYLLRSHLGPQPPARLWEFYLQLVESEQAFKHLKDDLALRPIFHRLECRIKAHIFVAFLAYCLLVTLRHQLRQKALGLTARAVLEKLATLQMLDVHFASTDERRLIFSRYPQPEKDHLLLLAQLGLTLPSQPPPRITRERKVQVLSGRFVVETFGDLGLITKRLRSAPHPAVAKVRLGRHRNAFTVAFRLSH